MESRRLPSLASRAAAALLLIAVLAPATLRAQEARGRITGKVVDPSKSAVPGASVTVSDTARGTSVSLTTNADGLFQVSYLLPGSYEVTVQIAYFKKYVQKDVQVQVNETRDLTITLAVGGVEETVSVSAEAAALNTSDANMGFTVDSKRLAELPLIHGDPYKIMGLATGLAHSGDQRLDRPYEPTHIVGYAYDGTRSNRSDLLIDGAPSTATANANEVIATYVPPSDLIQEFRVQTATFDSQFGNTEGGVTSIAIKAGTNSLKGTVYFFAEPSSLGANDFFGKARGQERIDSSSNRPGITLSGPVIKDKTFFTVGFERIKDIRPRFDAGANVWVPTEKLRNGDFSDYTSNIQIYDPLTRVGSGTAGQFVGQPFPGNVIPANRISPVARRVLEYYSLPKNPGLAGNIYDATLPETAIYNTTTVRIDQKVSNANRLFVRGSYYKRDSHYNDYMGNGLTSTNFQFISYQGVIDDVHVFNPTTVMNVRYGYNRFERNSGQEAEYVSDFDLTRLSFPSQYNNFVPASNRGFPRIEFPNTVGTAFGNDFRPITTHSVNATLNKSLGAHSVKGGAEMRIYREDSLPTGNARAGRYVFNNTYTRQNSASGTDYEGLQGYASFLLGLPSTLEISRLADYSEYSKTWGLFIQDDWKVNNKLTLNLGLRYEVETALTERNDRSVSGFDFGYVQPIQATVQSRYAALNDPALKALVPQLTTTGGLLFAGKDGGSRLYNVPKNSFLPRFGFVYQLNPKTVFRGGAGLFAGFLGQRRGDVIPNGWSQTTTLGTTTLASGAPIPLDWQNAFLSNPILEPVGNANGRQQGLGTSISFFTQDPKVSKQLRWQAGFQRELPGGFTLDAAYVGNYGYDIEISRNINALPANYLNPDNSRSAAMNANNAFLTATVTNPFAGLLPGTGFNSATIARQQLMRPYPAYGDITTSNNDGKSWYNSVQVGLQKRFRNGYTFGLSYTRSKWEQATEYLNAGDANPTRMISDLDVPNRLSLSGIFNLPFGKGRRFLSDASGVTEALLGGWQLQGVYTYQTGFPIPFGTDLFYNGGAIASGDPTTQQWFNTSPFTSILNDNATNATPVNHLRTTPTRFDEARRDAINSVDLSLLKNVKLKGEMELQLRAEFVNAFNSPYFPNPVVNPTSATFGQVTASNQANYARRAQLGVKLVF
jgi:hypothetical protein